MPCPHAAGVKGWCALALVGAAGVGVTLIAVKVWRDNRKYIRSRKNWENLKDGMPQNDAWTKRNATNFTHNFGILKHIKVYPCVILGVELQTW